MYSLSYIFLCNYYLNIEYFYKGSIQVDENEIEGVKAILDKIQKYQSGKMSEKETNKMSNKLREYPIFESIVVSFEKGEALSDEQIEVLSSNTSIKTKSINYNDLILNAESLLKKESFNKVISNGSFKNLYKKEKERHAIEL
jgi:hypothetical protein